MKNISAAIEVFELWLEKNGSDSAANKSPKPSGDGEAKADTVPGLGFKDADAARKTLEWVFF